MSIFEFLMVLVSLIIGLGIAELLTGVAQSIRHRGTVSFYWVHSIFVVIVFLALLQQWWEIWGVQTVESWTFAALVMMLGGPVGMFLIAHLIFPESIESADYRAYYYEHLRPAFWLAIFTVILSVTFRPLFIGSQLFALDNLSSFVMIGIFLTLAFTDKGWVHSSLVTLVLIGLVVDITASSFEIS